MFAHAVRLHIYRLHAFLDDIGNNCMIGQALGSVEVIGEFTCCFCRPDGKRLYRNAVLRQQGWMVVAVPWYEWPQADYRERAKYLQKRIQEAVAEYLQTSKSST